MKNWKIGSLIFCNICLLFCFAPIAVQAQNTICIDGKCYPVVSREIVSQSVGTATVQSQSDDFDVLSLKSDSRKFRQSLLLAAKKSLKDGKIDRIEHLRLVIAANRPRQLERMKVTVHQAAIDEEMATTAVIQWDIDKIIDFIEKMIPIIIKLIDLFSYEIPKYGPVYVNVEPLTTFELVA